MIEQFSLLNALKKLNIITRDGSRVRINAIDNDTIIGDVQIFLGGEWVKDVRWSMDGDFSNIDGIDGLDLFINT